MALGVWRFIPGENKRGESENEGGYLIRESVMGSLCVALKKRRNSPTRDALCKLVEEKAMNWVVETMPKKVNNC
jgi:hypothetical protein